jgi:SAM-dependent methyltransferase
MSFAKTPGFLLGIHRELHAGGYSARDGTIEFYGRVRALTRTDSVVLDFGAGRGAWFDDEDCEYRRRMRLLRGSVARVIGCDVDPSVLSNRSLDEARQLVPGSRLPFDDGTIDMIVADYVLEHVDDPAALAHELARILKPGGWICARTPTRNNYVSVLARAVANAKHSRVLELAQPNRKAEDVFPTRYLLNTRRAIFRYFGPLGFDDYSYLYTFEPQYHFNKPIVYRLLQLAHWLLPASLHGNLFVFLRKHASAA